MNKQNFMSLNFKEQLAFVNEKLRNKELSVNKIEKQIGLSKGYLSRAFKRNGHTFDTIKGLYSLKNQDNYETTTKVVEIKKELTTNKLQNNYSKEIEIFNTEKIKKDFLEVSKMKEDLRKIIEWYYKNHNVIKEHNLQINQDLFEGDLSPRSFKLYENVKNRLNNFISNNKSYKAQDIVNFAILDFLDKYEK